MAKKKVMAAHAPQSRGKKAPRPEKSMSADSKRVKEAPAHKPSMKHMEPAGPFKMPKGGEQSMAPDHKRKALPMKDAPKGVKGPNQGDKMMDKPKGDSDRY